jgi:subtilisin
MGLFLIWHMPNKKNYMQKRTIFILVVAVAFLGVIDASSFASSASSETRTSVLISFIHTPGAAEQSLVKSHGGLIAHSYHLVPAIAASLPESAIAALKKNPNVTAVEPDITVEALDAELDNTWGVLRIGGGTAHSNGYVGADVKVAVIDTGIDCSHPDLAANCAGGYDFVNNDTNPADDNGHGTHVAGTIAALMNGTGVVGVAPSAKLYALKVLGSNGSGSFSNVIAALQWAVDNHIQVTNNSYGSSGNPGTIVEQAFNNAEVAGIFDAAAAGNSGKCSGLNDTIGYPAKYASVIAITATDSSDQRPCWSSTGPKAELAAPGVSINSTLMGGSYGTMSGTSMATPHVAGSAALLFAAGVPDTNGNGRINDEIRGLLDSTAQNLGVAGRDNLYGYGLVRPDLAIASLGSPTPPPPPPPPPASVATTVGVTGIVYATSGGRNGTKNLSDTITLTDNLGGAVANASVSISLQNTTTGQSWVGSSLTGSNGKVTFTLSNAPSGHYTTVVTSVNATGLAWNGTTPINGFDK